jgi:DNA-binding transcriptional LysR family regulator
VGDRHEAQHRGRVRENPAAGLARFTTDLPGPPNTTTAGPTPSPPHRQLPVPAGHRLAGRDRVSLAEAADDPWVVPSAACSCRTHVLAACGAAGFTPDVAHDSMNWEATIALVAHGLGVALVPRLAQLPARAAVVRLPCDGEPRRKILTVTRPGGRTAPAVAAALDELDRLAPTLLAV